MFNLSQVLEQAKVAQTVIGMGHLAQADALHRAQFLLAGTSGGDDFIKLIQQGMDLSSAGTRLARPVVTPPASTLGSSLAQVFNHLEINLQFSFLIF